MTATVQFKESKSATFPICEEVKQDRILPFTLFGIFISALFIHEEHGGMLHTHRIGG